MNELNYSKNNIKILVSILSIFVTFVLIINLVLYGFTDKNYISIIEKKILATAGIYTEVVESVEINDVEWSSNTQGSWHIDKSARWTGTNTAEVTFDVSTIMKTRDQKKDVIFVLDVSSSMAGEKIEKVKSDSIELINYILSDNDNRVALIAFESTSTILSSFTKDKSVIISMIENLTDAGNTNYNAGLENVLTLLNDYEQQENRDLIVLFLTDGYPNTDIPNQVATYSTIKDKYPFITINGVQYEMGIDIIEDIKNISDNQYHADMETLGNVLFEASVNPEPYEVFEIVDYIDADNFYINSVDDIKVSIGGVALENENGSQKITWNLGKNSFKTGGTATMTIDLILKDEYKNQIGFYPTNKKEIITSKLLEEDEKIKESNLTPVLQSNYKVIYDANTPTGCTLSDIDSETHFIYETIKKKDDSLTCAGYLFKGWEITNDDVTNINDDYFIMPSHDVTIRAIWSKPNISKSVEGTVNEKATLYKVVKKEAESGSGYAAEYTGNGSEDYTKKVYYYNGAATTNNVLFANFCWKIVRTTDTGGVKLIYNGVPSDTNTCNNTGKDSQLSSTSAFNSSSNSPAYVGYMYNKVYSFIGKSMTAKSINNTSNNPIYRLSMSSSYNYYFAKSYTVSDSTYTLTNPEQLGTWSSIYSTMTDSGYYTCKLTTTGTCTTLYYVVGGAGNYAYTIALTSGKSLDEVNSNMIFGTEYIDNGDGTYSLGGSITTIKKSDWYNNYDTYKGKYMCSDYTSTTCSTMYYLSSTSDYYYTYENIANNYKYGNDVMYDSSTGTYKLIDTDISQVKQFWDYAANYNTLSNNHYTCLNTSGECSSVYYIYYTNYSYVIDVTSAYYITLTDGKKVGDALNEMLNNDDVNAKNSTIKTAIDAWYAANMIDYTDFLEDTIFCNDRSISDLGGWDPNGDITTGKLYFNGYSSSNTDLTCNAKTDSFTVSEAKGNGKLTYPVGLLTASEVYLALKNDNNDNNYLKTGQYYWLGSPSYFLNYACLNSIGSTGSLYDNSSVDYARGIRPSVSLKPGVEYKEGSGTIDDPYIVAIID